MQIAEYLLGHVLRVGRILDVTAHEPRHAASEGVDKLLEGTPLAPRDALRKFCILMHRECP
jgi:hypothetical protein